MSYIQCFDVNNYKPSDSLKNLFEELIIQPYKNHPPTQAWEVTVKNKETDYHRNTILDRGRTDFDALFNGLSPEDKVLLYCAYYMPMHLYSSYHIFTKHFLPHITEKIVFIDIGCGPLTSGIAIWAAARQCNITFIGIDRSQVMLNKAMEINNKSNNENRDPFFKDFHRILDYNQLPYYLSCHVEMGDTDDTLIIFNFCYVLASHTFDDDDALNSLIGVINRVVNEHEKHKICVVYQNPVSKPLQENWNYLKSGVITDSSMFDVSGFPKQDSTKEEHLRYETIWGEPRRLKVSYDSFNNFSYLNNYSDKQLSNGVFTPEQLPLLTTPNHEVSQPQLLPKNEEESQPAINNKEALNRIRGFRYMPDYITEDQHSWLLAQIDKQPWLNDLKRKVQHYGFKYDYKARKVNYDMRIGELPEWLKRLSQKLHKDGHMPEVADQVIVNEYLPGQGISGHIDCEPCFEKTIVSLSLGSSCVMDFTNKDDKTKKIPVWLAPKSLIVLDGEARYKWLHGIAARKCDVWDGHKYERQRRVSLTFRRVIIK